jgi:hypothetical protein
MGRSHRRSTAPAARARRDLDGTARHARRVVEIGSGPGFLAPHLLAHHDFVGVHGTLDLVAIACVVARRGNEMAQ